VPALVDTTLRLLGQEPLASVLPSAAQLDLAEILDTAGFAYLEVSGGGCFDTAVKRGVQSPWERIRALKARTETPLAMALRGRFLVGSRPVGGDFVRRFVESAAESGIDVFRLHDPLNDVSNLREASEAITAAGCRPCLQPRPRRRDRHPRRAGAAVARARRGARARPRRVRGAGATSHARARRGDSRR
jgi:pyruvate/oxaloacetate carboxyltransferase